MKWLDKWLGRASQPECLYCTEPALMTVSRPVCWTHWVQRNEPVLTHVSMDKIVKRGDECGELEVVCKKQGCVYQSGFSCLEGCRITVEKTQLTDTLYAMIASERS